MEINSINNDGRGGQRDRLRGNIIPFPRVLTTDERIEELFTLSLDDLVGKFTEEDTELWIRQLCQEFSVEHHRKLIAFVANSPHGVYETEMVTDILGLLAQNPILHDQDIDTILSLSLTLDLDYEWHLASCENLRLDQVARLTRIALEREVATADKDERRKKDRPFSDILFFLAHNHCLSPEALIMVVAAADDDLCVLEQVMTNQTANEAVMQSIPDELMERLLERKVEALTAIASAGNTSEVWDKFHPGANPAYDLAAIYNRSTPRWILRSLLSSPEDRSGILKSLMFTGYYDSSPEDESL